MSGVFWSETARLAISGAIVGAVAVPIGILGREIVRARQARLFPRAELWRVPWSGFELFFAIVAIAVVPDLLRLANVRPLVGGVIALPLQLAALFVGWKVLYRTVQPVPLADGLTRVDRKKDLVVVVARAATLGVATWAILAPLVLGINVIVTQVFSVLQLQTETHPLAKLGGGVWWERALFLAQACLAAPLIEEILFRGLLLPWVIGGRERNVGAVQLAPIIPPSARPAVILAAATLYASLSGKSGPLVFAAVLTIGLGVLWVTVRHHRRHLRGIYSSAAIFALVHSEVWPSPIPLFVLGLGLSWLAVRTRSIFAPTIVHGLFNAISAYYVLRGGSL